MSLIKRQIEEPDLENRILVLVGFHEKTVMDQMLEAALKEFSTGRYSGVVLTGTFNPDQPDFEGVYVNDEIGYMERYLAEYAPEISIQARLPSRSTMGNIRSVLLHRSKNVTFFVDQAQVRRCDYFLDYFGRTIKGIEGIEVISPEHSFRAGSSYAKYSGMMDYLYRFGLIIPGVSIVMESIFCEDNKLTDYIRKLKNIVLGTSAQH